MHIEGKSRLELLGLPLEQLRTVGPKRAAQFERLGLRTVLDLLFFFPRDYEDLTELRDVAQLVAGEPQSVLGEVVDLEASPRRGGRSKLGVLLRDDTGHLRCLWFNQPFMHKRFRIGQRVLAAGKPTLKGGCWEMAHPQVQWLEEGEQSARAGILPVYPLTEGLTQFHVRRAVHEVLDMAGGQLEESLPEPLRSANDLASIEAAIADIHFPRDRVGLDRARRRFVFQELLVLQLALAIKRQQQQLLSKAPMLPATAKIDARIRRLFPFELTASQRQVIEEIGGDLARDYPMNRLLQGDVGSGKTVVALYAMLVAVAHGYQAVLMAPTEVLARQHAATVDRLLNHSQVRHVLFTGGLSSSERQAWQQQIASGEARIIIGTQAILQNELEFHKLGLVVIDEQHKFGVRQRALLKQQKADPHYLVMTATPIPRTIAMTLFGDLDVSTLTDEPPGRQPVHTYVAGPEQRASWWEFFRKKLRSGRQGYVIAPLVEESSEQTAASVEQLYEELANSELADFRLGILHGRATAAEKLATMQAFSSGEIQVLVATTVVEVGIDVPNATVMTIEGAQRFGISQLHQLRGRVSRGTYPGYCCVFADDAASDALERLQAFAKTTDGFELAELDLALRGPGDLLSTRQHGLPPLHIADLLRDADVVRLAREAAADLVGSDPGLRKADHARLRRLVLTRYGKSLDLGDVG